MIKINYKYKKKVTITLESNSKQDIERIANQYFNVKIPKQYNNPDDKSKYVAVGMAKEDIKVNGVDKNG